MQIDPRMVKWEADPEGLPTFVKAEAQRVGVRPELAMAVMGQESAGKPGAVSPKGAMGLMQLMPGTAKELGVDPHDPVQNVQGGLRYLKQQLDAFGGDEAKALAAYNAGPGAVRKHGGVPPYAETQQYVKKISAKAGPSAQIDARLVKWEPVAQESPAVPEIDPIEKGGFGAQLSRAIRDIPRQAGLAARYGLEGAGNTLDMVGGAPIASALNAAFPARQNLASLATGNPAVQRFDPPSRSMARLADAVGLPSPRTDTERVVGDASRMMAGAAIPIGAAGSIARSAVSPVTREVASAMAANPGLQVLSGAASGGAGGYTRETGGDAAAQTVAALAAGIAAPMAASRVAQSATRAIDSVRRAAMPIAPADVDMQIYTALSGASGGHGVSLSGLPADALRSIRSDVAEALRASPNLSPDAVRRLVDYRLVGATPTRATLTLDPAAITQQKNLAKLGINSKDEAAQALGRVEHENNRTLISGLNDVGANTAMAPIDAGDTIMGALAARNARAKAAIGARYDAARATNGRSAAIDPAAFTQRANDLLDDSLLGGKLPSDVRNLLNKAAVGEMPMTVDVAEQFKTRIGDLQRATTDMAERKALGLVRQSLDEAPLLDGQGQQAIDAFNKARKLNRTWMGIVDRTPALQAVRDGMQPDKFVQQFIVGGGGNANVMDLAMLKRSVANDPSALNAIKGQIAAHLKNRALNGAADEVGNFSQSSYNKALAQIGDRKLRLFFSPDEIGQIKAIGRVSSYEQVQPRGSAVNNSNTASASLSAILERIANSPLLSKIPLGAHLAQPAQNIVVGIKSKTAANVPKSLLSARQDAQKPAGLLASPMIFSGQDDDQRRRGLLSP